VDLWKIEIELKLELGLHLFKSWSKFNPSSIHAPTRIYSDQHKSCKDSYAKNGYDNCDFGVWICARAHTHALRTHTPTSRLYLPRAHTHLEHTPSRDGQQWSTGHAAVKGFVGRRVNHLWTAERQRKNIRSIFVTICSWKQCLRLAREF